MPAHLSHVIGFDDGAFNREHRGDVLIVGAVFAGLRLDGVLTGRVRRDGANATDEINRMVLHSRFAEHLQAVFLQGVAMAGFNVVDLYRVHEALAVPVLAVARRAPDFPAIEHALRTRVRGGARKWKLIERLGPMEPMVGVQVQHVGIPRRDAERLIKRLAINGKLPEPLRVAHMIASALTTGQSRRRA
ncbi:MAG: DUF99 family protein [Gammaproteobacteria bacterium]|nr:DUF99 family protein [Gammaproteobacteria bacterium]